MKENRNILVVDDDFVTRGMASMALSRKGFEVQTADNGELAWEALQNRKFDIVITDEQMPELSGLGLCKRMQADPNLAHIPLAMITAKAWELGLVVEQRIGILAVIEKPFSGRALAPQRVLPHQRLELRIAEQLSRRSLRSHFRSCARKRIARRPINQGNRPQT